MDRKTLFIPLYSGKSKFYKGANLSNEQKIRVKAIISILDMQLLGALCY